MTYILINTKLKIFINLFIVLFLFSCSRNTDAVPVEKMPTQQPGNPVEPVEPVEPAVEEIKKPEYSYTLEGRKSWFAANDSMITDNVKELLAALNRVDLSHLRNLDSIVVPNDFGGNRETYLPFPINVEELVPINRIIFFSYPTQIFAAYENGILKATGPTNMGRKNKKTPTGLFFTNWKAVESISTVDDEWILKWNFNIANFDGVGFHQYALPGYPVSHSCLRLQENDAKFLYNWASQWVVKNDKVVVKGTPVIVYGEYPFGKQKPWWGLASNPKALEIGKEELMDVTRPFMEEIMKEQEIRVQHSSDTTGSK